MRVALLADTHGNVTALEAVLADIQSLGGVDQSWVLGDLATFGPEPERTLERLTSLPQVHIISGNTDRYIVTGERPIMPAHNADDWVRLPDALAERDANFRWTVVHLDYRWCQFIRDLPERLTFDVPGYGSVLAVHGSPRSDDEQVLLTATDSQIEPMLLDVSARLVLCGHTHDPMDRQVDRWRVVNPGSTGMPSRDRDNRASYAILTFSEGRCQASLHRVPYDVDAVIAQVRAGGNPAWQWIAFQLLGGGTAARATVASLAQETRT